MSSKYHQLWLANLTDRGKQSLSYLPTRTSPWLNLAFRGTDRQKTGHSFGSSCKFDDADAFVKVPKRGNKAKTRMHKLSEMLIFSRWFLDATVP
ncbi:Alpha-factor-transporting ATPase [Fusarium oxysporum f. sp. albedinis]|nr:Alpha-factor-transporting ATPase [Fusarium oxysporum f. sp. albedinis]